MRRRSMVTVTLVALVALGAAVFFVWVFPWVRPPTESEASIRRRWRELEVLAKLPPAGTPALTTGPLLPALERVAARGLEVEALAGRGGAATLPRVSTAELSGELHAALEDFARWERAAAPLNASRCAPELPPLAALRLGRLALAAAERNGSERQVGSVLRLAAELRQQGTFLHAAVGFVLAGDAARWARDRERFWPKPFERYRPRATDVFPAVVRDGICMVEIAEGALKAGDAPGARPPMAVDPPPGGGLLLDRELLMLRKYYADLFERAVGVQANLDALSRRLGSRAGEELPHSFLVRAMAAHYGAISQMSEQLTVYDELLANPPRRPTPPPRPAAVPDAPLGQPGAPQAAESVPAASAGAGGLPLESSAEPQVAVTVDPEGVVVIPKELVAYYSSDMSQLARQARIVPSMRGGQIIGFKIFGVRPGSLFRRLGLRNGDTVLRIGDHAVVTPDAALQAYETLRQAEHFEIGLERRGRRLVLRYRFGGR